MTTPSSLFEFVRYDRFDAHNFFDDRTAPVPPLEQHQFGGSLGGRFVKDRTFFFVSYERQRTRRSITKTFSVPDAALRAGDFSGFGPICDPGAIDPATGACTPFANNQIPVDRLDPIAQAFLAHVPLPNGEGRFQNLTSVEPQDKAAHQFSVRVDHRLSDTDQLFVRFSSFDADEVQPFGTSVQQEALVPGFGRTLDTTARNLGVSHTRTFGISMLNELRFGYMSVDGGQASLNAGVDFAGQVGLRGVSRNPRDVGFPQISTAGLYSTMGDPTTFVSRDNEHFEVYDNFLITRGDHRLKFGGYLFHLKFRPVNADTARGAFTYTGQWSGNALADYLLGFPTSARSGIGGGDEDARTTWLHLYAQDDWRPRGNLTINYGLRYELNSHMKDVDNRLASIDLSVPGGRYVIASDDAGKTIDDIRAPPKGRRSLASRRRVLERRARHDVAGFDILLEQPSHRGAGVSALLDLLRRGRGRRGAVGKAHTKRLDGAGHDVRRVHAAAGAGARAGVAQDRLPLLLADAARQQLAITLEGRDDVETASLPLSGPNRAAIDHQRRSVETTHSHDAAGHVLVASRQRDIGVVPLRLHHRLDRIGDQITRLQGKAHPRGPHRQAIAHPDGVEPQPHQAGCLDALLHPRRQVE